MQRSILFIFLFLLLAFSGYAQQGRQYSFTHYNTSTGAISNQVNSVVQDPEGYIWTGTTDGLQRFDGTRYKTFRHSVADPSSLPSNAVWQVICDKKKNLWVLLASGRIGIFNTRSFTFHEAKVVVREEGSLSAMKRLITDEYGNIFLLLAGWTVLSWNETNNDFSEDNNVFRIPAGIHIADMTQQPGTKKYWFSVQGSGIAIFNELTKQFSYFGNNIAKEPAIEKFANVINPGHMLFDKKGRLWMDTWGPGVPLIWCYDLRKNKFLIEKFHFHDQLKTYYEVHGFFEQRDGTVWIRGLGLFAQFLEKENKFQVVYNGYLNGRSIFYDAVHDLYEDRENNLWVATRNNGLYRFNPSHEFFINISHLHRRSGNPGNGSVLSFIQTRWGTTLISTWGDGIFNYDSSFNLIPTNVKGIDNDLGPTVWDMRHSGDSNTIWMSAQPGIYALNQKTRTTQYFNPPQMKNRTVRQITEDKMGNLWIGMQSIGLFKWAYQDIKRKSHKEISLFNKIPEVQINKLITDHKGWIWVGTSSSGAYVIDPTKDSVVMHFSKTGGETHGLPDNAISSILEYNDSLMLITTSTTVNLYDRIQNKTLLIGSSESMSGFVTSMERDSIGYLWISTTSGLYRVNAYLRMYVRFNREDGIENDNFTLASSRRLPDGRLLFGSSNQFIRFNPQVIRVDSLHAGIRITDFKAMNKSLQVDSIMKLKRIRLSHNSNSLEIEFSPLTFSNDYLVRYKLEGLDKDWKVAERNNQAIYSYLPAGTYTLLLQSLDAEGRTGKEITRLIIKIDPPFWKSWWFYTLLILLAGVLLYWFDRERMKRKQAVQKMRSDIAGNLHGEINTALNNINILSEMARLKSTKDPVKAEEYIEQIHDKSHNMIIAMDDMLWSLDPDNDNMQKTVERMREYIEALNNRHGTNIDMLVEKNVEQLKLNMKLRHEAFLLFKEGIQNLVQAGIRNCHIHIGLEKLKLNFSMEFANDVSDMQQLHNLFHRQDMEKRIEALGAELEIQVHKSSSLFGLKVPVV